LDLPPVRETKFRDKKIIDFFEDKNFSVGLFNLLNNPYRKIELPSVGGLRFVILTDRNKINFY
jgi:hypothetical protein